MDDIGEYIGSRRGYNIYRKVENGKGIWFAVKTEMGNEIGNPIQISYEQARGYAPIDSTEKLGMQVGSILKHGRKEPVRVSTESKKRRNESVLRSSIRRLSSRNN